MVRAVPAATNNTRKRPGLQQSGTRSNCHPPPPPFYMHAHTIIDLPQHAPPNTHACTHIHARTHQASTFTVDLLVSSSRRSASRRAGPSAWLGGRCRVQGPGSRVRGVTEVEAGRGRDTHMHTTEVEAGRGRGTHMHMPGRNRQSKQQAGPPPPTWPSGQTHTWRTANPSAWNSNLLEMRLVR